MITDITRLLREQFNVKAKELSLGLTLAQARVIFRLARNEGISQVALARLLEIQPITLLRQIDRLEEMQFILRTPNPNDRRAQKLSLTDKGLSVLVEILKISESMMDEAMANIDAASRKLLINALASIKENLMTATERAPEQDKKMFGTGSAHV